MACYDWRISNCLSIGVPTDRQEDLARVTRARFGTFEVWSRWREKARDLQGRYKEAEQRESEE
jgi:hypothetical protein